MINKKIGFIGCGNMGGAILFGALESGVLPKENAYVYDINPAMMEKAESWGVNLCTDDVTTVFCIVKFKQLEPL